MYYILDKKEAMNYRVICLYHSADFDEEFLNEKYGDNWCVFTSDYYNIGVPIVEGNTVRSATEVELIQLGFKELSDGQYLENGELKTVAKPNHKAKWNKELNVWETNEALLNDGEVLDENQKIVYINKPNHYAKWNKETKAWETNEDDLADGEILTETQDIETISKPNEYSAWNRESKAWEIDLNLLHLYNIKNIRKWKPEIISNGFDYNGHQVSCDFEKVFKLQQAYQATKYVSEADLETIPEIMQAAVQFYPLTLDGKATIELGNEYVQVSLEELQIILLLVTIWTNNVEVACMNFIDEPKDIVLTKQDLIDELNAFEACQCYKGADK